MKKKFTYLDLRKGCEDTIMRERTVYQEIILTPQVKPVQYNKAKPSPRTHRTQTLRESGP